MNIFYLSKQAEKEEKLVSLLVPRRTLEPTLSENLNETFDFEDLKTLLKRFVHFRGLDVHAVLSFNVKFILIKERGH